MLDHVFSALQIASCDAMQAVCARHKSQTYLAISRMYSKNIRKSSCVNFLLHAYLEASVQFSSPLA